MEIGLLGYGVVGKGVANLLKENNIKKILARNEKESKITDDFNEFKKDNYDLVIECLNDSKEALEYILYFLNKGIPVISSNKAIIAKNYRELIETAKRNKTTISFEAAVGGGIPILHNILDIKRHDEIFNFEGIVNGTSNYILDTIFNNNLNFNTALDKAIELGYAEKDPSSDIDGIDSLYKTAILSNLIYDSANDINYDLAFGIRYLDDKAIKFAKDNDYIIKLLAMGDKANLMVMPMFISNKDLLASIHSNYNAIIIKSKNLDELTLIGQGAGRFPTADAIMQDLNRPMKDLTISNNSNITNGKVFKYYLSDKLIDDSFIDKEINDIYITKELSFNDLVHNLNRRDVFIGGFYD